MKLYKITYDYTLVGLKKNIFGRMKTVKAAISPQRIFITCEKENIKEEITNRINLEAEAWASTAKEEKLKLVDYSDPFFSWVRFDEVTGLEKGSFSYEEATIIECLKHLTPGQYRECYGEDFPEKFLKKFDKNA